jgi:NADH-quinone oxidoreductase subunit C
MADSMTLAKALQEKFPQGVTAVEEFRGEVTVVVERKALLEVAKYLRDTDGYEFNLLSDLCGIDYLPQIPRFAISYIVYSLSNNQTLRLKVFVPETEPSAPSLTGIYPSANWPEREVYDMFGISFDGHPDLRRILMPFDWTGYPLRKDYPLGYEEVEFSFNFDRVQIQKPKPTD